MATAASQAERADAAASQPIWAQVYAPLRDRITALDLTPGSSLSEKALALQMGVSRTPVREAFIRLSEEGLLDIYPQHGTFVAPIRVPAVLHAAFVRESLECSVIRRLAHIRRSGFLDELRDLIDRQWVAVRAGDDGAFFALDERMHQAFAEEAGHEPVWGVIQSAKIHLDRVRRLALPDDLKMRGLVEEHRRIAAALTAQDAEGAADAMREHLQGIVRGMEGLARRWPEYFEAARQPPRPRRPNGP